MTAWNPLPTGLLLRRICENVTGGVGVIAALALPVVLGAAGLAYDVNHGLDQRGTNQRVADMAALSAAMAYKAAGNAALLQPTAQDIAIANGLTGATVTAAPFGANCTGTGSDSVRVTVRTTVPYMLAKAVGMHGSYAVTTEACANLSVPVTTTTTTTTPPPYASPCFLALSNGADAIRTDGGATISAAGCTVAAIGSINNQGTSISASDIISGGGSITNNWGSLVANSMRYAGSFNNQAWNNNVPAANTRTNASTPLADPWANNAELVAAFAQLPNVPTYTAVSALSPPTGTDYNFDWSPSSAAAPFRTTQYGGEYVVPAGTYNIKNFNVGGGIKVTFANGANVNVSGTFTIGGGATVIFGDGDMVIKPVLTVAGGTTLRFGNGKHSFGGFDLGGGGNVTMGNGDFIATGGIKIAGDTELSMGNGNVTLGKNASGNSIDLGGSARLFMGDGTFTASGNITTVGGSKLVFGKTTNHYINGNMTIGGAVLFGAGRYTITGNFANGTGGTTWPYTSSLNGKTYGSTLEGVSVSGVDQAGVNVTFVAGGTMNLAGGAKTKLVAATSSTSGGAIANLLFASKTNVATSWAAGASSSFIGTIYLPNSAVTMSGGNNTTGSGQCFSLIASRILATGGAMAGTACPEMSGAISANSTTTTTTTTTGGTGAIKLVK